MSEFNTQEVARGGGGGVKGVGVVIVRGSI
jgi:hypothetical protein